MEDQPIKWAGELKWYPVYVENPELPRVGHRVLGCNALTGWFADVTYDGFNQFSSSEETSYGTMKVTARVTHWADPYEHLVQLKTDWDIYHDR